MEDELDPMTEAEKDLDRMLAEYERQKPWLKSKVVRDYPDDLDDLGFCIDQL